MLFWEYVSFLFAFPCVGIDLIFYISGIEHHVIEYIETVKKEEVY